MTLLVLYPRSGLGGKIFVLGSIRFNRESIYSRFLNYFPDPRNKYMGWDNLLHQSIFPLDYVKRHVQSVLKVSEADQYVVQNLTWSGVYLRSTLSNNIIKKVPTLVPLTATGSEVFVSTMTTFFSDSYDAFKETLNHMKSLKLKSYPGDNVTDCCVSILLYA